VLTDKETETVIEKRLIELYYRLAIGDK